MALTGNSPTATDSGAHELALMAAMNRSSSSPQALGWPAASGGGAGSGQMGLMGGPMGLWPVCFGLGQGVGGEEGRQLHPDMWEYEEGPRDPGQDEPELPIRASVFDYATEGQEDMPDDVA